MWAGLEGVCAPGPLDSEPFIICGLFAEVPGGAITLLLFGDLGPPYNLVVLITASLYFGP